jgi:hypothetical protein
MRRLALIVVRRLAHIVVRRLAAGSPLHSARRSRRNPLRSNTNLKTGRAYEMMAMSVTMHPIWQSGIVILAVAVAAALLLQMLVHYFVSAELRRRHTVLGAAIFSVIGTTYAVLLAFMATTAWEQYSAAEALARREADLVGAIYRVSQGVADPAGPAIRADLMAYLTQVINVEWPAQVTGRTVAATEPDLADLDRKVIGMMPGTASQSNIQAYLISAASDVAMVRRDRRLATHGTIPNLVWVVLLSGGALMVGFSYVLGAPTQGLHLLMTAALVASGVLVLLLIVGLSSPFHGAVTIPPDAYTALLADLREAP